MNLQDLIKMTASLSRISNANSNTKEFFNECVEANKGSDNEADEETLAYYIKKDADFISKFIELVEQETQKANRVLMTFKTLDEMNAFIKAGNECGKSWFEDDVVKCYLYK
jgi:acetolactate synthase small subunit